MSILFGGKLHCGGARAPPHPCAGALTGLPHGLTESAEEAVRQWKFEPALRDGEPVAVIYYLTVSFRLAKIRKLEDLVPD